MLGTSAVGTVVVRVVLPPPSLRLDRAAVTDAAACIGLLAEEIDTECPEL